MKNHKALEYSEDRQKSWFLKELNLKDPFQSNLKIQSFEGSKILKSSTQTEHDKVDAIW